MHTSKVLSGIVSAKANLVGNVAYVEAYGLSIRVRDDVKAFDFTFTPTQGIFRLWSVGLDSTLVIHDVDFSNLNQISSAEVETLPDVLSVAASLTGSGYIYAVLASGELVLYHDGTDDAVEWSPERQIDFDLDASLDGTRVRILYSKTASPEQIYIDEYNLVEAGDILASYLRIYDFKFGVGI